MSRGLLPLAGEALREAIGAPVRPFERALHDRAVAEVRGTLEPEVLETEWAAGRVMSPETPRTANRASLTPGILEWAIVDSNHGPPPYQSGALTN
jgi:hypothetical protein